MEIKELGLPIPGERFNFHVTGGTRPTHIEAYIGRKQVLDTECADPPCHAMIFIPDEAGGSELWLVARDTFGNVERKKFIITDTDASAGGVMTMTV